MAKFLDICEDFDPSNTGSPRYDLYNHLKEKGINASVGKGTDSILIDIGDRTIHLVVKDIDAEEENQERVFDVDQSVDALARKDQRGVGGAMRMLGLGTGGQDARNARKAGNAKRRRDQKTVQAIDLYDQRTDELEDAINRGRNQSMSSTNVSY